MPRWKLPAVLVLATTAALAGCGSSGSKAAAPKPSGLPASTTVPLQAPNDTNLRKYAVVGPCVAASGGWQASGTMMNPTNKDADYTITVYFATAAGGTIEGTGTTKVAVKAGKTANWTATAQLTNPDPKTSCTLRGVG